MYPPAHVDMTVRPAVLTAVPIAPNNYRHASPVLVETPRKPQAAIRRSVTDSHSLLLFLIASLLAFYVAGTALTHGGSLFRLTNGVDAGGAVCAGATPFLYVPLDPAYSRPHLLTTAKLCIARCPSELDVKKKHTVPVMRRKVDRSISAATFVEYAVQSPVYASQPVAGRFCRPLDASLDSKLSVPQLGRPFAASVIRAWPVLVSCGVILPLLLALFLNWVVKIMPSAPKIIVPVVVGSSSVLWGLMVVAHALTRSTADALPVLLGGFLLIFGGLAVYFIAANSQRLLTVTSRVNDFTADLLFAKPNGGTIAAPAVAAVASVGLFAFYSIVAARLLAVRSPAGDTIPLLPLPGAAIVSLAPSDNPPLWATIYLIYWTCYCVYSLEVIRMALQFAVAYTAAMWYYSPTSNCVETSPSTPSAVAMLIGLKYHLGSFVLAAPHMYITRTIRAINGWVRPRYDRAMRAPDPQVPSSSLEKLCDSLTIGTLVEMAAESSDLRASMQQARRQVSKKASAAARLLGAATLTAQLHTCLAASLCGGLAFVVVAKAAEFAAPEHARYVSMPFAVAALAAQLASSVAGPIVGGPCDLTEGMLYCYLQESDSEAPEERTFAPFPLRDLIADELQVMGMY